ncbi:MAG: hypothetical protein IJ955_02490 [Oscillospiraceae bacterium]|nr:hypothetical protein [Oscillospiraceae bacterium]
MSGFQDMVAADIHSVFLNSREFAEVRTVEYNGETYQDIPIVLSGPKEQSRYQLRTDHMQGLYKVSAVLHCAQSDLGGALPEKGCSLKINNREGGGGYFKKYYVASSICEMGMLRLELEAIDE